MAQIDASLTRLGTDHVDLYQIHRFDDETPVEETMAALHDVVKAGKARYLGASSMSAWQFAKMNHAAALHGWTQFVSMQPQYSLAYREEEREMIPYCIDARIGVLPWSPLARGFLAGNRHRGGGGETRRSKNDPYADQLFFDDASFAIVDAVSAIAAERGISNTQVALAWLFAQPGVTAPVIGASKDHHIPQAVDALSIALSAEEIDRLEAPYRPRQVQDLGVARKKNMVGIRSKT
jgi:aryl-alcohol dehydrogenase-like predicted oxidoreductase